MSIRKTVPGILVVLGLVVLGVWTIVQRGRAHTRVEAEAEERARAESVSRHEAADSATAERRAALLAEITTRVHFDFDRSAVRPADTAILERKISILQGNPTLQIQIAGHCDERGSRAYNLALGRRRATAARRYLEDHGIAATRIHTVSYGKDRPLDLGRTAAARERNRRDEFEIVSGDIAMTR